MFFWATLLWIAGLLTWVPWGVYYLLFQAPREQYAILIVGTLGWVFGYWGVVGPLLTALKIRAVFRAIEHARSRAELEKIVNDPGARDAAIDLIAAENGIPKFVARRVYRMMVDRVGQAGAFGR